MNNYNPVLYAEQSHYYRGKVIDHFSQMEGAIEFLIGQYYFNNRYPIDFGEIILDRLTFEAKRESLRLIRLKQAVNFIKTGTRKHPDGDLFERIRKLNVERVRFAHYPLVIPSRDTGAVIILTEQRDGRKHHSYTKEKIEQICSDILAVNIVLLAIETDGSKPTK